MRRELRRSEPLCKLADYARQRVSQWVRWNQPNREGKRLRHFLTGLSAHYYQPPPPPPPPPPPLDPPPPPLLPDDEPGAVEAELTVLSSAPNESVRPSVELDPHELVSPA